MIKTTVVDKEKKGKINWLFPDENQADMDITVEDFRQMVREAEKGEGMSLQAYKEKMNVWWQNHIITIYHTAINPKTITSFAK